MFKLPHVAPQQQVDSTSHTADSIFISEAGILRFARDYGLTPYVASTKQVRCFKRFSGIIAPLVLALRAHPCLVRGICGGKTCAFYWPEVLLGCVYSWCER
jgi:hypothetical protein